MLHLAEERMNEYFDTMNITYEDDGNVYEFTKNKLKEFSEPKKNTRYKTFLFRSGCQAAGESFDKYLKRLCGLAKYCKFNC